MYICNVKRLLLTLVGIILTLTVIARHYDLTSRRISTADGLPSNTVIRIWQDKEGYMLFETRNGTCRYDGYEMIRVSAERPPISCWATFSISPPSCAIPIAYASAADSD